MTKKENHKMILGSFENAAGNTIVFLAVFVGGDEYYFKDEMIL